MDVIKRLARVQAAASTNATSVKGTPGSVRDIVIGNNGAGAAYFKLYDKATVPTVGTDTPVATLMVPAGRTFEFEVDHEFSAGVAYAITGGAADSDTTAVLANQVVGFLKYT